MEMEMHMTRELATKKWKLVTLSLLVAISLGLTGGLSGRGPVIAQSETTRRVSAPYFTDEVWFSKMSVFWFGRVTPTENYTDVRVGYNDEKLRIRVSVFDRRLWYDEAAEAADPGSLTDWDAAALYLSLDGNEGSAPSSNAYRFISQLSAWEPRENYQAVQQGDGSSWVVSTAPFATTIHWRGDAPNTGQDDRGWAVTYDIPFESLGLDGPPQEGTTWGLSVVVHDRDDEAGTTIPDKIWPETLSPQQPETWGQLVFGLPNHTPPSTVSDPELTVIREKLNGASVPDAAVGGTTGNLCPGDSYYIWNEWGNDTFGSAEDFNIQNQTDIADWPCYAKYYVTFPLDALPSGKTVVSATLTLHQWGNSGGGHWDPARASLIWLSTVDEAWQEQALTWNNAPLPRETIGATRVGLCPEESGSYCGSPGVPHDWDVSQAVTDAHAQGQPLRLVLYSSDTAYHSGKYFSSSEAGDWNAEARPTLTVAWGQSYSWADLDRDCDVDVTDTQAVANRWRCASDDACYVASSDVDADGLIDIEDISAVASRWGCECGDECYDAPFVTGLADPAALDD